jgi:hypothetical protein
MSTFNFIVTLAVPVIVVAYIVWDLLSSKYTVKFVEMPYDKIIDKINFESMGNTGNRLSQSEICENTQYIMNNYKDILK